MAEGIGRIEYPQDLREFRKWFSNRQLCLDYLVSSRWPEGFRCPHCLGKKGWLNQKRYLFECSACGKQTSPTAGTVFHRSKVPIQEWFWAAYLIATHTPGISALQLQRQLGLGSYRTAWHMLHRLRQGMVNPARTRLKGVVEVDETIIGHAPKGMRGRGILSAPHMRLVAGAVEVEPYADRHGKVRERARRVRLEILPEGTSQAIQAFLEKNVQSHSTVRTDGWTAYTKTVMSRYQHIAYVVGPSGKAHLKAPHIHRVFGNLKTWLLGTYHAVDPTYLPIYLNEYVFRFNRRRTPMAAFQTLLGISARTPPLPMTSLPLQDSST